MWRICQCTAISTCNVHEEYSSFTHIGTEKRCLFFLFFFFKQKTAYEIYQCDWSSDVCSSDLTPYIGHPAYKAMGGRAAYTLATAIFIGGAGVFGDRKSVV